MKSILELLILLREQIKDYPNTSPRDYGDCYPAVLPQTGLCRAVYELWKKGTITILEKDYLRTYLYDNRPEHGKYYCAETRNTCVFWPLHDVLSRQLWVNYLIRKESKHAKVQV